MSSIAVLACSTDHLDGTGQVARLERRIASLTGFRYALSMSSASIALEAAYAALGLGPGDKVVAPSFTAPETVAAVLRTGCMTVFADIDPGSFTLDPKAVERCVTPRTKAIVGVDGFGWPHDSKAIRTVADRHGLAYVADCAQGFGVRRDGRFSGSLADASILSCNAQKEIRAGEAGILLSSNHDLHAAVLRATQHPCRQARELGADAINYFGSNGRINPIATAAALEALPTVLDDIAARRRRAPSILDLLKRSGLVEPITVPEGCEPTFPCFVPAWRSSPQPVALLSFLHDAGFSARLRDLPLKPIHLLPGLHEQFPGQVRIPYPLVHTEDAFQRRFCLEVV